MVLPGLIFELQELIHGSQERLSEAQADLYADLRELNIRDHDMLSVDGKVVEVLFVGPLARVRYLPVDRTLDS